MWLRDAPRRGSSVHYRPCSPLRGSALEFDFFELLASPCDGVARGHGNVRLRINEYSRAQRTQRGGRNDRRRQLTHAGVRNERHGKVEFARQFELVYELDWTADVFESGVDAVVPTRKESRERVDIEFRVQLGGKTSIDDSLVPSRVGRASLRASCKR